MDVPSRAKPAGPGDPQAGRAEPRPHVARHIDLDQVKGNALGAGALQGDQAVADLLEAGPEALSQQVQIVTQLLRRLAKGLVGHHHGAREVAGQGGAVLLLRRRARQAGPPGEVRQQVAVGEPGEQPRQGEGPAAARQELRDQQAPAGLVEDSRRRLRAVGGEAFDPDAVPPLQRRRQSLVERAGGQGCARGLGSGFDLRIVVAVGIDGVDHLLARGLGPMQAAHPLARDEGEELPGMGGKLLALVEHDRDELPPPRLGQVGVVVEDLGEGAQGGEQGQELMARLGDEGIGGEALAQAPDVLAGIAIGPPGPDQGPPGIGRRGDQLAQAALAQVQVAEQGIARGLLEVGQQAALLAAGEGLEVDVEALGQLEQQRAVELALIVLDQVQVAGRDAQLARHGDLGQALAAAQAAQLVPQHGVARHGVPPPASFTDLQNHGPLRSQFLQICGCSPRLY